MRIDRMQERRAGQAVRAACCLESRRVQRTRVAADHVVAGAARVVRIINAELRVVEEVEGFRAELGVDAFPHLEVLE